MRDLTGDLLSRLEAAAHQAAREEGDAVRRFVHAAAGLRMGAVIPVLLERLVVDQELIKSRTHTSRALDHLIRAAHESGRLRPEVGAGDLILLSIRLSHPLPSGLSRLDADGTLLHRHLDLALDGLTTQAAPAPAPAPGEPLTFADLVAAADRPNTTD
ncbi:hypothetical protein OG520_00665 [Streptomyces sp. NBC_00984]|uniref:SbtR family transcriptional regulator n=1 Tax=Streptomyces sp. NBC_00984 TaxID=2903700 RepID=UPI00386CC9DE|nr:hypothetical protein OG520_00665 [Streptomyces sp. NBC_00984]